MDGELIAGEDDVSDDGGGEVDEDGLNENARRIIAELMGKPTVDVRDLVNLGQPAPEEIGQNEMEGKSNIATAITQVVPTEAAVEPILPEESTPPAKKTSRFKASRFVDSAPTIQSTSSDALSPQSPPPSSSKPPRQEVVERLPPQKSASIANPSSSRATPVVPRPPTPRTTATTTVPHPPFSIPAASTNSTAISHPAVKPHVIKPSPPLPKPKPVPVSSAFSSSPFGSAPLGAGFTSMVLTPEQAAGSAPLPSAATSSSIPTSQPPKPPPPTMGNAVVEKVPTLGKGGPVPPSQAKTQRVSRFKAERM